MQPSAVPVEFHMQLEIQKPWGSCLCKVRVYFSRLRRRDLSKINLIAFVSANWLGPSAQLPGSWCLCLFSFTANLWPSVAAGWHSLHSYHGFPPLHPLFLRSFSFDPVNFKDFLGWGVDTACYLPASIRSRQCLPPILIFSQQNQTFCSFQVVSQKASKYVRNVLKASEAQYSGKHGEVNSFA